MRIPLLIFTLISFPFFVIAQQYPELVTDRPDQTESSAVVPRKTLQIETGFVTEKDRSADVITRSYAYNSTLLRYGLLENMELRLGLEYLGTTTDDSGTREIDISGFGPLYIGFKLKILEEEAWIPEAALLGNLTLPFTANQAYKPPHTGGGLRFALAHTLSERLSLGYNLGAEWNGRDVNPEYFLSASLGIGITSRLGAYAEIYSPIPEKVAALHMVDAGLTFLITPNFQLDVSGGIGLNDAAPDHFLSCGLSWQIPH